MTPLYELKNVQFGFEPAPPFFANLNLQVAERAAFAVLGPSGAGKTVLLKLLSGLLMPTRGNIRLNAEAARVGMAFQRGGLFDSMSVGENLLFPLNELKIGKPAERRARAEELLGLVGLSGNFERQVNELSGGMQKRACLARALVIPPQILILDDPTAGLDPVTALEVTDLICSIRQQEALTLIFSTVDPAVAMRLADSGCFLDNGRVLIEGPLTEVLGAPDSAVRAFTRRAL